MLVASETIIPTYLYLIDFYLSFLIKLSPPRNWITNKYVPDSKLIGLSGIGMHVPACANPGLKGKREFREINEPLFSSIRCVVGQGLAHQIGFLKKSSLFKTLLHKLDCLQGGEGVEMAVDTNC